MVAGYRQKAAEGMRRVAGTLNHLADALCSQSVSIGEVVQAENQLKQVVGELMEASGWLLMVVVTMQRGSDEL